MSTLVAKLAAIAVHDPALAEIVALLEPARIQIDEAARALRGYRQKLDLDPAELDPVEERLAAIHDVARKYRVRPEALPALLADTEARLAALAESADAATLAKRAAEAEARYRAAAGQLSAKREFAAHELEVRVTEAMQNLAMAGGRLEIALEPLAAPAGYGLEQIEFRVASHPKQPLGPLAKVASGGELSRIALAIQVVTSEVGEVPTLDLRRSRRRHRRRGRGHRRPAAAVAGNAPAGALRHAPAAGGGVRRRALPGDQARRHRPRCAPKSKRSTPSGRARRDRADARRQRDHRQDARSRQGAARAAPAERDRT